MAEKTIKMINKKDRYFNGVGLNGIITIEAHLKNYYLRNGFVEYKGTKQENSGTETEPKNNIVDRKKVIEELEHLGIEFRKNAKTSDLVKLLEEARKQENSGTETEDLEEIKKSLIDESIVETTEGLTGEEIKKLAKDNGLI